MFSLISQVAFGFHRFMGQFPLSLIPTFFVPLLLIFHLICFIRVGKGVA